MNEHETQLIKIDPKLLKASPFQSRKTFAPEGLAEMMQNIREHGIIQPPVVRLSAAGEYELVVGERRTRAAVELGLVEISVLLSQISDAQAEGMVLSENLQREGLLPAEEAAAFERLLKLRGEKGEVLYTLASLAKMVSKDVEYVTARLKLLICPPDLVAAVNEGRVSVSTAMLVGRIPSEKARAICAKEVLMPEIQQVPLNYEQTKELIREKFMVKLDAKRFDLDDASLVSVKLDASGERCQGGACMDCPFRSGNLEGVELKTASRKSVKLAEPGQQQAVGAGMQRGADANLCTLPSCHALKLDAAWRDKKLQAEREGKKTLDGKAAEKAFSGHNGDLAHDSGYAMRADAVRTAKGKGVDVSELKITRIVAKHPDTHEIVELVSWKECFQAICDAEEQAKKAAAKETKSRPQNSSETQRETEEQERNAAEALQAKLDKLTLHEGLTEIANHITGKGMDLDFMDLAFQLALGMSGADGMYCLGKWLDITMPKGTANSGRDYEDEILKLLRERCQTSNAWLAHITLALIARGVKWSGVRCEDFELVLARCGVKVKELERRAKALLAAEQKGKAKPGAKAAKPAKDSSNPTDWSADAEVSKTAAADAVAKGKVKAAPAKVVKDLDEQVEDWAKKGAFERGDAAAKAADAVAKKAAIRAVKDYRCDGCGCDLSVPFGKGDEAAKLLPGEMKCVFCGGKWQKPIEPVEPAKNAAKVVKASDNTTEFAELVKQAKAKAPWSEILGPMPEEGTKERKAWDALRVRVWKAAKKVAGVK